MKVKSKKILIISYYWPPSGGSGVQRWMYFVKYLKIFGWDPYVLTVDENSAAQGAVDTKTLFGKFTAFIRGNFFVPDARKGWRPFALRAAQKLIKEQGIGKVVTTGPPHSTHLVGAQLQKEFGSSRVGSA
ncbi:MAG: hypothetical protein ACJ07L_17745 [Opitutales bacterium]